jgi:hypothetical protein
MDSYTKMFRWLIKGAQGVEVNRYGEAVEREPNSVGVTADG